MLEYETFLMGTFPVFKEHFQPIEEVSKIEKVKRRAIRYLDMNCSAVYGFSTEIYLFKEDDIDTSEKPIKMVPTAVDSGQLLALIKDTGIDPATVNAIATMLKNSRRKDGFWNFFIHDKAFEGDLVPDDIDVTAGSMMALHLTGNSTREDCLALGKKMIKSQMLDKDGVMSTCLTLAPERKIALAEHRKIPFTCGTCLTNALWFLASFGLETEPEVMSSVNYITKWIESLAENKDNEDLLPGMVYYTNKPLMYFFLARYLATSEYARKQSAATFVPVLLDQLAKMAAMNVEKLKPLNVGCILLAVTYLNLHVQGGKGNGIESKHCVADVRKSITKLVGSLMTMQDSDGSYPPWIVYKFDNEGRNGGTKAYATAVVLAALCVAERDDLIEPNTK